MTGYLGITRIHRFVRDEDPKIDPRTPRTISRPTWLPIARAALLPSAPNKLPASSCHELPDFPAGCAAGALAL